MPAARRGDGVAPDSQERKSRRTGVTTRGRRVSSAGRHADAPPGSAGLSSALRRETLPLHVAPELLGHLGRTDRLGAEQRFQAVRAALKADRVTSERQLLAPGTLLHGVPPFFLRSSGTLQANDYHARRPWQRKSAISRGSSRTPEPRRVAGRALRYPRARGCAPIGPGGRRASEPR